MNKKRIPKPSKKKDSLIPKPNINSSTTNDKVVFSFTSLEWTKYFNLSGTCPNWSFDLFNMLKNISNISKNELINGKYKTYRVHNHENAHPPDPLPQGVSLKDCYQLRISTSKGGIHGVFSENIFYVIWLDPLHNMYPDNRFGGLREITPPNTCCKDLENIIKEKNDEINQLKEEIHEYEELINSEN